MEPWAIRPALKAILLALLPGLEEEASDDFEPTLHLINKFRESTSRMNNSKDGAGTDANDQYFWQSLFLASITTPSRRLGVLAYLNRYLPKLGAAARKEGTAEVDDSQEVSPDAPTEINSVISPEPGLLIRCFASGLADDQILVQRNFLDLLVTHLPLNSSVLQSRITEDDLERLVIAAVGVVTRRDMSLNRRLWAWLLGPEPANDDVDGTAVDTPAKAVSLASGHGNTQSQYFSRFGLKPLVNGLLKMVKQGPKVSLERTKPFRISLSLMDRWEVGGFVVPAVFLPIIESVQAYESATPSRSQFDEVFRSASAFFDGVESGIIFSELLSLVDFKLDQSEFDIDQISHNLELAHFIIENFNVQEEDMLLIHVPLLLLSTFIKVREILSVRDQSPEMRPRREVASKGLTAFLNLLAELLAERAFTTKGVLDKAGAKDTSTEINGADVLEEIHAFYGQTKENLDLPPLPFAPKRLSELILRESYELVISAVEHDDEGSPFQDKTRLLIALLKKLPRYHMLRDRRLYSAICNKLQRCQARPSSSCFSILSSITSAVSNLYFIQKHGFYLNYEDFCDLVPTLVGRLWWYLSPSSPKFHVEAVRCLWLLHSVTYQDHLVEASITSLMIDCPQTKSFYSSREHAEKFFVLWNHSHHGTYELPRRQANGVNGQYQFSYHSSMLERPLFIVLDLLFEAPSEISNSVQRWLQNLSSVPR